MIVVFAEHFLEQVSAYSDSRWGLGNIKELGRALWPETNTTTPSKMLASEINPIPQKEMDCMPDIDSIISDRWSPNEQESVGKGSFEVESLNKSLGLERSEENKSPVEPISRRLSRQLTGQLPVPKKTVKNDLDSPQIKTVEISEIGNQAQKSEEGILGRVKTRLRKFGKRN